MLVYCCSSYIPTVRGRIGKVLSTGRTLVTLIRFLCISYMIATM